MILHKIKKNKACPAKLQRSRGFVILFAVTMAAIFLSIALGVSSIALNEVNFSTSAKDTENAFNAADIGTECALFYDNPTTLTLSAFGGSAAMSCAGNTVTVSANTPSANEWTFYVPGLNNDGKGWTKVIVDKVAGDLPVGANSKIFAYGYNKGSGVPCATSCTTSGSNTIEREIDTPTY